MPREKRARASAGEPGPGPRGRPRDPAVDEAILQATLDRMAEHGYAGFSVDDVAAAAKTTKPTIYLRYPSKAVLATSALSLLRAQEPQPATGDPRGDLVGELTNFRRNLLRPNGLAMVGTLLAEERHVPELIEEFRVRVVGPRRAQIRRHLDAGVEAGLLAPEADLEAAVNMLVGAFYALYLAQGRVPEDWPARIVDTLWNGLAAGRAGPKKRTHPPGSRRPGRS